MGHPSRLICHWPGQAKRGRCWRLASSSASSSGSAIEKSRDERVGHQGSQRDAAIAGPRRRDRELLVRLHRLHEAAHPGLERRLGQHLRALPRDSRRDLDDRRVRQLRQGRPPTRRSASRCGRRRPARRPVRRGATRSAARPPRSRTRRRAARAASASRRGSGCGTSSSSSHSMSMTSPARDSPPSRWSCEDVVERVVILEVVARDRARQPHELRRRADVLGDLRRRPCPRGSRAVDRPRRRCTARSHDRWLSPTCSSSTCSGSTPNRAANRAGSRSRRCTARSPDGRRRAAPG